MGETSTTPSKSGLHGQEYLEMEVYYWTYQRDRLKPKKKSNK